MFRLAVGIEYDGAAYAGWQTQAAAPGIQDVVERALAAIADAPVELVGAGRTDAGVHARSQVAHFDTDSSRGMRNWTLGANTRLPADIAVRWVREVPPHFHARYSAVSRTYRYVILNTPTRSALGAARATWVHRPLHIEPMRQAAALLLGEHDFSAFRAASCQAKSAVRRLSELDVARHGDAVVITVTANAFLHHMVRNLAGLLVTIGQGEVPPEHAAELLAARDRTRAPATAPADGLYLWNVSYPVEFGLPREVSAMMADFPTFPV